MSDDELYWTARSFVESHNVTDVPPLSPLPPVESIPQMREIVDDPIFSTARLCGYHAVCKLLIQTPDSTRKLYTFDAQATDVELAELAEKAGVDFSRTADRSDTLNRLDPGEQDIILKSFEAQRDACASDTSLQSCDCATDRYTVLLMEACVGDGSVGDKDGDAAAINKREEAARDAASLSGRVRSCVRSLEEAAMWGRELGWFDFPGSSSGLEANLTRKDVSESGANGGQWIDVERLRAMRRLTFRPSP